MKSDMSRKTKGHRLRSEDVKHNEDPNEWTIVRLHSKIKTTEIKYSDLLSRIHKFVSDISNYFDNFLPSLSPTDQDRLYNDINYFMSTQDSIYTLQLFTNFKQEVLERLYSKDFSKETFKVFLSNALNDLTQGIGVKEGVHERKRSQHSLEVPDQTLTSGLKRELTPVRHARRSPSPAERPTINYHKENTDLKNALFEVTKQRDYLKAWKENILKNPNFDLTAQKIIKELKDESDLLMMKNTCLHSKLVYIVSSVSKFLSISSRFQKPLREKEGFLSMNFYENEKHRLEVKLREILDNNEAMPKGFNPFISISPFKTVESESKPLMRHEENLRPEVRKRSRDNLMGSTEKINMKVIEEINKQFNEKIEGLNNQITRLEADNRALKSKYFLIKREIKLIKPAEIEPQSKSPQPHNVKILSNINKALLEKLVSNSSSFVESFMQAILDRIEISNERILSLEYHLRKALQSNLSSLIAMNERAETSDNKLMEDCKAQIENLEYVIIQNKNYSDQKIQELEEAVAESEKIRSEAQQIKKIQDEELVKLTQENARLSEMTEACRAHMPLLNNIETLQSLQSSTLKSLHQSEASAQQLKFERDLLEQDNSRISEEIVNASKRLLESEEKLQVQAFEANKKIEEVVFEKNQVLEDMKKLQKKDKENFIKEIIEKDQIINDLKSQVRLLEEKKDSYKEQIATISSECASIATPELVEPLSSIQVSSPSDIIPYISSLKSQLSAIQSEKSSVSEDLENLRSHSQILSLNLTEELKLTKKHLYYSQCEKETLCLYLSKQRETFKSLESFLQSASTPKQRSLSPDRSLKPLDVLDFKYS